MTGWRSCWKSIRTVQESEAYDEECASCQRDVSWTESGNVDPQALTPVQWLSIIGSSGMGALCYVPETKLQQEDSLLSLDEMQEIALNVLSEKTDGHADISAKDGLPQSVAIDGLSDAVAKGRRDFLRTRT